MPESRKDHLAMYGRIRMLRSWCNDCETWAFVENGMLACCGASHEAKPHHYRRSNFVAACKFCNRWKGCIVFKSLDEARIYLAEKWKAAETKGGTDVYGLLEAIPSE